MPESGPSDAELLADWLECPREPAFHALVARYTGLVHMASKRICGDETLAAEASQLAALSSKDREALLLRFYRSLSVREIAVALVSLPMPRRSASIARPNGCSPASPPMPGRPGPPPPCSRPRPSPPTLEAVPPLSPPSPSS